MNLELIEALKQIEREKKIDAAKIIEALEGALLAAYRRNYGPSPDTRVEINPETGEMKVFSQQEIQEKGKETQVTEVEVTPSNFGRIAAQTAKQVILQRIREAERETMFQEYSGREGDIVTGIVQQNDQRYTLVNLGTVEALLPPPEQVPGEKYEHGTRIKTYIVEVRKTAKEPQIIVSRTHPGLLKRLFELEVPEIYDGFVEIKAVAREPGYRSKIAVASREKSVDPVGACVGPRGSRVRMVVSELKGEKIDVIQWNDDPKVLVANALSPAKVKSVDVGEKEQAAKVIVGDDQLSLAIGKEGQNARLAAKLTGLRIDIKSESQAKKEAERAEERKSEAAEKARKTKKTEKAKKSGQTEVQMCKAVTTKGTPCKSKAKPGSEYCGRHEKSGQKK